MAAVTLSVFLAHYNAEVTLLLPDTLTSTDVVSYENADTGYEFFRNSSEALSQRKNGFVSESTIIPEARDM